MDILVVDDTKSVQSMLVSTLTLEGHRVDTANNGLDALGKAQQGNYDLFVIDHLMPLMNGVQLIKNFQNHSHLADKKIIFITTQAIQSVKALAEYSLIDKVLAKPFDKEKFLTVLSEVADPVFECETLLANA